MVTKTRTDTHRPVQRATTALPKVPEKVFQKQVEHFLRLMGWLVFHPYDSRKSAPGFPDIVAVRAGRDGGSGRILFAELKTVDGRISPTQVLWGEALGAIGGNVEYYLWRPDDRSWAEIERVTR